MGGPSVYRRRFLMILSTATALTITALIYHSASTEFIFAADPRRPPATSFPVLYRDAWPDPDHQNIFLIETSAADQLQLRFICSVESFCSHNPAATVWLLVTAPALQNSTLQHIHALQTAHHNLRIVYADFDLILQDTPLLQLYNSEKFYDTDFLTHHKSDIARVAVVHKSGGLYADLDILALRPLLHLRNFFALQSEAIINGAVFHLQRGHPLLLQIMNYIVANYDGWKWGAQGPFAVTAVAKAAGCHSTLEAAKKTWPAVNPCSQRARQADDTSQTNKTLVCDWLLLDQSSFYPVSWKDADSLFVGSDQGKSEEPIQEIFPVSCGVHLSNKLTSGMPLARDSLALKLITKSCPLTVSRNGPLL